MATAIEYGLVAALVAVAAVAGLQSCTPQTAKPSQPAVKEPPSAVYVKGQPGRNINSEVFVDRLYKCELISVGEAVVYRKRDDGTLACPGVPRLNAVPQKTKD